MNTVSEDPATCRVLLNPLNDKDLRSSNLVESSASVIDQEKEVGRNPIDELLGNGMEELDYSFDDSAGNQKPEDDSKDQEATAARKSNENSSKKKKKEKKDEEKEKEKEKKRKPKEKNEKSRKSSSKDKHKSNKKEDNTSPENKSKPTFRIPRLAPKKRETLKTAPPTVGLPQFLQLEHLKDKEAEKEDKIKEDKVKEDKIKEDKIKESSVNETGNEKVSLPVEVNKSILNLTFKKSERERDRSVSFDQNISVKNISPRRSCSDTDDMLQKDRYVPIGQPSDPSCHSR